MQQSDEYMIFERYQQLNEIGLPGGQQFSVGKRLGAWAGKKFTGGLLGKGSAADVEVEKEANKVMSELQVDARKSGATVAELMQDPNAIKGWIQNKVGVDPTKIANWSELSQKVSNGSNSDVHNLVKAALTYRNRIKTFGHPAPAPAPETTSPTPETLAQPAPETASAPPSSQPKKAAPTPVTQSKQAVDAAIDAISKTRARDRKGMFDYALQRLKAIQKGS